MNRLQGLIDILMASSNVKHDMSTMGFPPTYSPASGSASHFAGTPPSADFFDESKEEDLAEQDLPQKLSRLAITHFSGGQAAGEDLSSDELVAQVGLFLPTPDRVASSPHISLCFYLGPCRRNMFWTTIARGRDHLQTSSPEEFRRQGPYSRSSAVKERSKVSSTIFLLVISPKLPPNTTSEPSTGTPASFAPTYPRDAEGALFAAKVPPPYPAPRLPATHGTRLECFRKEDERGS